jgi:ComF family protein
MHTRVKQTAKAALDLVFPRACLHCGEHTEGSLLDFVCIDCTRELHICQPPACTTCGYPFFGMLSGDRSCPHCAELDPLFSQGKTLFLAKGAGRSLLHHLKYQEGFYALKDLRTLAEATPHYRNYFESSTLVPVPLHPTKERERGYNQSDYLVNMLSRLYQPALPVENLLIRTKFTQTQTRLNRSKRQQNVKNAFALAPDAVLDSSVNYILVDDVFTTGATLNACARVLLDHGATQIKVATLGHG